MGNSTRIKHSFETWMQVRVVCCNGSGKNCVAPHPTNTLYFPGRSCLFSGTCHQGKGSKTLDLQNCWHMNRPGLWACIQGCWKSTYNTLWCLREKISQNLVNSQDRLFRKMPLDICVPLSSVTYTVGHCES